MLPRRKHSPPPEGMADTRAHGLCVFCGWIYRLHTLHRKAVAGGRYIDATMSHFSDLTRRADGRSNWLVEVVSTFKLPADPASRLGPAKKGTARV